MDIFNRNSPAATIELGPKIAATPWPTSSQTVGGSGIVELLLFTVASRLLVHEMANGREARTDAGRCAFVGGNEKSVSGLL